MKPMKRAILSLTILIGAIAGAQTAQAFCLFETDCPGGAATYEVDPRCKSDLDCPYDQQCNTATGACFKPSSATACVCTDDGDACTDDSGVLTASGGCFCPHAAIPGCRKDEPVGSLPPVVVKNPVVDLPLDPVPVLPTPPTPPTPLDPPSDAPPLPTPPIPPDPAEPADPTPKETPPEVGDDPVIIPGDCGEGEILFDGDCIQKELLYIQGGGDGSSGCALAPAEKGGNGFPHGLLVAATALVLALFRRRFRMGLLILGCLGLAACEGGSPAPASDPADAVSESTAPESIDAAMPQTDAGTIAGTDASGREPNDEVAIPVLPPSSMDPNDPAALPSPVPIPAKPDLRTGDMTTDGAPGDEARIMDGAAEGAATLPTRYEIISENRMLREDRPASEAGPRYGVRPVAGYAASL